MITAKQFIEEMYPAECVITDTYSAWIGDLNIKYVPDTDEWYVFYRKGANDNVILLDMADKRTAKAFVRYEEVQRELNGEKDV